MKTWATPNGLQWLEAILQERFGHAFSLQPQADGTLSLTLPGSDRSITLATDGATYTRADSDLPCAQWDACAEGWHTVLHPTLPAPGAGHLPSPLIEERTAGCIIHYDILGLTYWMLNRIEEIGRTDLDVHGRFPAVASHAYKHDYLDRPIVDEWLHILGQVMERVWPGIALKWHQFSIKVSHDVDNPSLYAFTPWKTIVRMMGGHLLKRRDIKAFFTTSYIKLASRAALYPGDPYNTFDWLMEQSEHHGLQSAFYFICGGNHPNDSDYRIDDPRIRQLMRHIHERGHEIGLHPSYGTYKRPELIVREAQRLWAVCAEENIRQKTWGGRMHCLRWCQPITLRAWSDAGMAYDSTLSYADHAGFRCGTCFEYPAYDPEAQESLPLRIRPLIVMEVSVIGEQYMNLGVGESALTKIFELKEMCRRVAGCFTLLWHNSSLTTEAEKIMYKTALGHNP